MHSSEFGASFKWGTSTAAYQIEGAYNSYGKGPSIWDDFVRSPKKIKDKSNANIGCDHYHRLEEDLQLIRSLNIKNYRFSISWSRILPEGEGRVNTQGIDFYNQLIDTCLENGIEPWITLYHWDLPFALEKKGGWTNRNILYWFEDYVALCLRNFGDRVRHWIVLNEPMVFTGAGYFLGYHAPGKKGISNFLAAMHHATLCQGIGGRLIRDLYPTASIGTTFSCSQIDPLVPNKKHSKTAQRFDALLNRLFIEPSLGLGYPVEDLPALGRVEKFFWPNDENKMAFDFDFIGLQNYTREIVKHNLFIPYMKGKIVDAKKRKVPTTTMGWEIHPPSIYHMIKKFDAYPGVSSIIITENGVALPDQIRDNRVQDPERIQFINDYLQYVLKAKKEGAKVNGYFVWSLMDNFEWAEGYTQRFGLVYTDYKTKKRTVKDSGIWYSKFLKSEPVQQLVTMQ